MKSRSERALGVVVVLTLAVLLSGCHYHYRHHYGFHGHHGHGHHKHHRY